MAEGMTMDERSRTYWLLATGFLAGVAAATLAWSLVLIEMSSSPSALSGDFERVAVERVIRLEVRDWEWDPAVITLQQGETATLEITSEGGFPHGLWIPDLGVNVATPPGEVTRVEITPEKVGEFFLGCANDMCGNEAQHEGMTGKIIVLP